MSIQPVTRPATRPSVRSSPEFSAGAAAIAVLLLTSAHHAWGAFVFDTPWRLHIVFFAAPAAMAIAGLLALSLSGNGQWTRLARWAAALLALVFPVAFIGFYEGGLNHVVKNMVYFAAGEASARALFPSPAYEMPSDMVFEVTGIMQFPLALLATWRLWPLVRLSR